MKILQVLSCENSVFFAVENFVSLEFNVISKAENTLWMMLVSPKEI